MSLLAVWEALGVNIHNASEKKREDHIKRKGPQRLIKYQEGDLVLIRRVPKNIFSTTSDKDGIKVKVRAKIRAALQNRWKGPYRVTKVINETTMRIMRGNMEHITTYKNTKKYHPALMRSLTLGITSVDEV